MREDLKGIKESLIRFCGVEIIFVGEFKHRKTGEMHYVYQNAVNNEMLILRSQKLLDLFTLVRYPV